MKKLRLLMSQQTKYYLLYLQNIIILFLALAFLSFRPFKNEKAYIGKIISHFENQMKIGLDNYGPEKTDFWMASLDTYYKNYPENLERPTHIPNRVYLDRYIDAPHGSALYWDMPSVVLMYNLTGQTGNKKYGKYADNYVKIFLKKCIAKNGVFLWGNHYYYNAFIDSTVKFGSTAKPVSVSLETETGDLHEIRPLVPAWDVFWKIDPVATEKEIRQSAANHTVSIETGQFNRHADGQDAHAFLEAGGVLVYSLAWLYYKTKDESLLKLADKMAGYSFGARNKTTGLLANDPSSRRWDAYTATTESGLWAGCILSASKWIPANYAEKWQKMADEILSIWLKYAFDPQEKRYFGMLNIKDGSSIKRTDDYAYKPDTYSDIWEPLFPKHDYPMSMAESCLQLYKITKNEKYKEACYRWVDIIKRELPARKGMGAYPEHYGRVIHFLLSCSEELDDNSCKKLAFEIADEAVHILYSQDMFRGHPGENRYDAVDGVGILSLTLMWLETGKKPDMMGLSF